MVFGIVSCLLCLVANIRLANADTTADGIAIQALADSFPRLKTLVGESCRNCRDFTSAGNFFGRNAKNNSPRN